MNRKISDKTAKISAKAKIEKVSAELTNPETSQLALSIVKDMEKTE